jgi:RHS repeat-associated protein
MRRATADQEDTTTVSYDPLSRPTSIDYAEQDTPDASLGWSDTSELTSVRAGGESERYRYDPAGRLLRYSDPNGELSYSYDGDGRLASRSYPSGTSRYTGQLREEGTGRYHLRARDYDPEMAAFQTPDPISPGLGEPARSPYSYVGGRPTTMVDPSGMIGIGDVTPDFIEDAAKTVDDNVIDPVGNGISEVPGAVDDGWDATAGVRHTVGGLAEDGAQLSLDAGETALNAGADALQWAGETAVENRGLLLNVATAAGCVTAVACAPLVALNLANSAATAYGNADDVGDFAGEFGLEAAETALFAIPAAGLAKAGPLAAHGLKSSLSRGAIRGYIEGPGTVAGIVCDLNDCAGRLLSPDEAQAAPAGVTPSK